MFLLHFLGFALARSASAPAPKVVVGYVQAWNDAPGLVDQTDYAHLTHLNIAFANPVDSTGTLSFPPHTDDFVLKGHQANIKVLVSIGGGDVGGDKHAREQYFDLISDAKRPGFVSKLVAFTNEHHLDGIDVDLEGPAINKDYAAFVSDLGKALKAQKKLLTVAVSKGYGGDQVTAEALACFDLVSMMAYDGTGPWEPNNPGQHSSMDVAKDNTSYWLGRGVPKSKLVLGVPFSGYGFGEAFNKGGYTYAEITAKYPGAETQDQVGNTIWYNGIPTIRAKAQFVAEQGLAGVMIWSIDQDVKGKNSLLATIYAALFPTK